LKFLKYVPQELTLLLPAISLRALCWGQVLLLLPPPPLLLLLLPPPLPPQLTAPSGGEGLEISALPVTALITGR
jgi:hypothetical protein